MKKMVITWLMAALPLMAGAQSLVRLYDGPAPGSEGWTHQESLSHGIKYNVTEPCLEVFLPENPSGMAMLVVPGGGMMFLSYTTEGTMVAEELTKRGIAAFVLSYRTHPLFREDGLPLEGVADFYAAYQREAAKAAAAAMADGLEASTYTACSHVDTAPFAFADADKAMAWIRAHSAEYGIEKIGMVGFSAGAVTTLHQAQFHNPETRPDFAGIVYGGWDGSFTVPEDPMPMFLCAPVHDVFSLEESLEPYIKWRAAGAPVEYHTFSASEHGYGASRNGKSADRWIDLMLSFMKDNSF